jgi:hypothetical protein
MATKKRSGDTAQTSVTLNSVVTAATTASSAAVLLTSAVGLAAGQQISGPGIPANDTIATLGSGTATPTGNLTYGSTAVASLSSSTGLVPGQPISGAGIAAGTTIASIGSGSLVLSQPATAGGTAVTLTVTLTNAITLAVAATATSGAVPLTIVGETQVIGLQDWSISWKAKSLEATTTDDASYESFLPSSGSWTVKAKYIYLMGDPSQATYVRSILSNPQTSTQLWNFFPTDRQGDDAFTGQAFIDGIDFDGAGVGKILGMGVSLKGSGPLAIAAELAPVTVTNTITGLQAED